MRPNNKALLAMLVAVAIVVSIGGAAIFLTALQASLPIPAGTTFIGNTTQTWIVHFNVSATGGRLVGAWIAFDGTGDPTLVVLDGIHTRPPDYMYSCQPLQHWTEYNGSIDAAVNPGTHTLYWGPCFGALKIVITETIRVV
jgi:hypothetical protein